MNRSSTKTIALLVPKIFNFSETFFSNDLKVWEALGYKVHIFPLHYQEDKQYLKNNFHKPPKPLSQSILIRFFQVFSSFFTLLVSNGLKTTYRFYKLEREARIPLKQILARIYSNQHILANNNLPTTLTKNYLKETFTFILFQKGYTKKPFVWDFLFKKNLVLSQLTWMKMKCHKKKKIPDPVVLFKL